MAVRSVTEGRTVPPLRIHHIHQSFRDYTSGLITGLTDPVPSPEPVEVAVTTITSGSAPVELAFGAPDGSAPVPLDPATVSRPRTVRLPRFRHPLAPVAAWRAVSKVTAQPCDVVHWQAAGSTWVDLAFSRCIGRHPTVVTVHDMVPHPGDSTVLPGSFAAIRRLARRADRVIVHADHVRDQAVDAGVDPDRVEVVAHGELGGRYRARADLPLAPPDAPVVLFFGRAQDYKGLDLLVQAMERVVGRVPGARLLVAGAGPGLDAAFPAGRRWPDWCEVMAGRVADRDVAGLFARAAVVGMPYREASQSGVAALAAGFGRPVVATAVPGLTDSVEDGVTGLLVPPGSIDELADALVRVLNDAALAARLGEGAFAAARSRLSWSSIAEAHRRIYWATWLIHNGEGVSVPSVSAMRPGEHSGGSADVARDEGNSSRSASPDTERIVNREPKSALDALADHRGPVLVDLDETLLLSNSTSCFIDRARPALLAYVVLQILEVIKPWRWTGGAVSRDTWRVRTLLVVMPWTRLTWKRHAPRLALAFMNRPLAERLAAVPGPVVVATLGFTPVVAPLVKAMRAEIGRDDIELVSMSPWRSADRRTGKLAAVDAAMGPAAVAASAAITDSLDDRPLLEAVAVPLLVVWPDAHSTVPFRSVYVPLRYLSAVKRPGGGYIRKIIKEDLGLWILGSIWLADQPISHGLGLVVLALAFWSVYEMGYLDNDRMGERHEASPQLSDAYRNGVLSISMVQQALWAVALSVVGLFILRLPSTPDVFDALRWGGVLVVTFGVFGFYNRIDKQTRVLLFPLLQLLRVGAFLVVVPTTAIVDVAIILHALSRSFRYYLYRTRDGTWPTDDLSVIRLILFAAASGLLASQGTSSDLWSPTSLSLLAWHLFLARHHIPAALRMAHRIDRPERSRRTP